MLQLVGLDYFVYPFSVPGRRHVLYALSVVLNDCMCPSSRTYTLRPVAPVYDATDVIVSLASRTRKTVVKEKTKLSVVGPYEFQTVYSGKVLGHPAAVVIPRYRPAHLLVCGGRHISPRTPF